MIPGQHVDNYAESSTIVGFKGIGLNAEPANPLSDIGNCAAQTYVATPGNNILELGAEAIGDTEVFHLPLRFEGDNVDAYATCAAVAFYAFPPPPAIGNRPRLARSNWLTGTLWERRLLHYEFRPWISFNANIETRVFPTNNNVLTAPENRAVVARARGFAYCSVLRANGEEVVSSLNTFFAQNEQNSTPPSWNTTNLSVDVSLDPVTIQTWQDAHDSVFKVTVGVMVHAKGATCHAKWMGDNRQQRMRVTISNFDLTPVYAEAAVDASLLGLIP